MLGFFNAAIGHGFLSLVAATGLHFVIWGVATIGGIANDAFDAVALAFPTAFKFHIMSPEGGDVATALAHQLGFAVAFFALGLAIFRRRDV
jgi:hypothetical protein